MSGRREHHVAFFALEEAPWNITPGAACPEALADGRYRWRHSQVLKAAAKILASASSTGTGTVRPVKKSPMRVHKQHASFTQSGREAAQVPGAYCNVVGVFDLHL